ncbi:MAG: hypothetical protein FWH00_05340, partial [Oscillospiraceae bacterium]|nr:hypothetical protein [Oscillospiraceae bacterium]
EAYEFERQLAALHGEDPDDIQRIDPSSLRMFITKAERGEYLEELMDGIFTAPIGRAVTIEIEGYAWFVIRRLDALEDEWLFDSNRNSVLRDLGRAEFDEELAAHARTITAEQNRAAISRYNPARLQIDF